MLASLRLVIMSIYLIAGASGKNCVMDGFSRFSLDAKLAIAITANFVNHWTTEENEVH